MAVDVRHKRDAKICRLYKDGHSPPKIGKMFELSPERVRQILRAAGVYVLRKDKHHLHSERDTFLGININEADKAALRQEAERRGLSMSGLTADLIKDMLHAVGAAK